MSVVVVVVVVVVLVLVVVSVVVVHQGGTCTKKVHIIGSECCLSLMAVQHFPDREIPCFSVSILDRTCADRFVCQHLLR